MIIGCPPCATRFNRDGFRRRRLVTSLLDPDRFPASELARLYHLRWDIETFYTEEKVVAWKNAAGVVNPSTLLPSRCPLDLKP